ncbi:TPA: peptidoglycan DD-metalloendopeptidase family protein [Candidatus Woesearchaeota archaeon]|uniref:Peptidase M23 n=2 Tax=Candidatus Uhriibacteriota TaxID=1752732 RepID=A0A0G0V860_9BACT|nr:MAG: Peptidase M23 [Candidatus Uhrbacteria bacterium GW2011_GWA2_41_10]KKR86124.1 MAG: Peptidase M23 [Candidatus Uhrbacteria bacterium GW2011_GWC2_41_11]KKR97114.1 MAG: Peptidase M23 [Candidatus Uhrbacteria bacterium GW2011_GWF2_41_16]HBP00302.1 hypothetical protein [Candidatus Uhrbacteria bacterium]HIH11522.1 peptidoglycan DD-metalloendopeptidase family protein [Candidatus Woesearchaeota archaeon]
MHTHIFFLITFLVVTGSVAVSFLIPVASVMAEKTTQISSSNATQILSEDIEEKKTHIDQIQRKIEQFEEKISAKQAEAATLHGQLELLENRVAKTGLEIESTELTIAATDKEIQMIENDTTRVEQDLEHQRTLLKAILQEIDRTDDRSTIELLLQNDSFSELFGVLESLETVNADLRKTLENAKDQKRALLGLQREKEGKKDTLEKLSDSLQEKMNLLEREQEAKQTLITQSQASEAQFTSLVYDLREEREHINRQVASLQAKLEKRLSENDLADDSSVLSWPVSATKGISAYFHDPSYPYRHLFEHSGIDLPVNVGTPVVAAGPGYVAWTKQGTGYGNYVMIIHTNGIATLYAHLSKILVEPEQFITRGQVVGLSGGKPGMPGAGLSTGPHLHFEVRKDGIPTNPLDYLE